MASVSWAGVLAGARPAGWIAGLCVGVCMLPASGAGAAVQPPEDGALSPRLADLARPAVRGEPAGRQAALLDVPREGPGSLVRSGGSVLVDVRFSSGAAARAQALRARGAKLTHVSRRYQTVTALVAPAALRSVAATPFVESVAEVQEPVVSAGGAFALTDAQICGDARSEGDAQLRADEARKGFEVDGDGVTVGILSDSFDRNPGASTRASEDVASGDLPGPANPCGNTSAVDVVDDPAVLGVTDEGRAMAQIVHDLAPGASLSFATAFTSLTSFADNIRVLRNEGADVIVDDVSYFREPFFQEGPAGFAASNVTASGASYFSSAGNANSIDAAGRNIGSWETPQFRGAGSCPPAVEATIPQIVSWDCLDFDPGDGPPDTDFSINVPTGATLTVDLQWAQPWFGVTTDLDAFLLDESGGVVAQGLENNVSGIPPQDPEGNDQPQGTDQPVEVLSWTNGTGGPHAVRLAVNQCADEPGTPAPEPPDVLCNPFATPDDPRLKFVLFTTGGNVTATEYPSSAGGDIVGPTVTGHSGAEDAISVAATPYSSAAQIEPFSSRGPVRHYFGPVVGTAPAAPIPAQTLTKPNISATDGVRNTFFPGSCIVCRFFGTSASAPHAAAVAALVRDADSSSSVAQVRDALEGTARPVGSFGPSAAGQGLVDAVDAVAAVLGPPDVTIADGPRHWTNDRTPTFSFDSSLPVTFDCSVDGRLPDDCGSPHTTTRLRDGAHTFTVSGTDVAKRSASSAPRVFNVDTRAPRTGFRKRPRRLVRSIRRVRRVFFAFRTNEQGVRYRCKIDRRPARRCGRRIRRRLRVGRHVIRVSARDRAGNFDRTPAVFRFRIRRLSRAALRLRRIRRRASARQRRGAARPAPSAASLRRPSA